MGDGSVLMRKEEDTRVFRNGDHSVNSVSEYHPTKHLKQLLEQI